jgi:putative heme-binding domain-containing protein
VESRLAAHKIEALQERVDRLTGGLPPANDTLRELIEQRRQRYAGFQVSLEHGAQVFQKHCAACHQVGGKGTLIGPQLDGIGNRGLERVLEDVLAPNQNVDVAFRASTLILADGRVVSGLVRREEGEVLVVANNKGEELKLPKSDIDEQAKTTLSLMPENVSEIVPEDDFHHLVGYLLSLRGEPATVEENAVDP